MKIKTIKTEFLFNTEHILAPNGSKIKELFTKIFLFKTVGTYIKTKSLSSKQFLFKTRKFILKNVFEKTIFGKHFSNRYILILKIVPEVPGVGNDRFLFRNDTKMTPRRSLKLQEPEIIDDSEIQQK